MEPSQPLGAWGSSLPVCLPHEVVLQKAAPNYTAAYTVPHVGLVWGQTSHITCLRLLYLPQPLKQGREHREGDKHT